MNYNSYLNRRSEAIFAQFNNDNLKNQLEKFVKKMNCKIIYGESFSFDIIASPFFVSIIEIKLIGDEIWSEYLIFKRESGDETPCIIIDTTNNIELPEFGNVFQYNINDKRSIHKILTKVKKLKKNIDSKNKLKFKFMKFFKTQIKIYSIYCKKINKTFFLFDKENIQIWNGENLLNFALLNVEKLKNNYDKSSALINIAEKCFNIGHNENASEILNKALKTTSLIKIEHSKERILNSIILIYASNKQLEKANNLIELIKDIYSKIELQILISEKYIELGQTSNAYELLNLTIKEIQKLDSNQIYLLKKMESLLEIVDLFIKLKEKEKSLEILSNISNDVKNLRNNKDTILHNIALKYIDFEEYKKVNEILEYIQDDSFKTSLLFYLFEKYTDLRQKENALKIYSMLKRFAKKRKIEVIKTIIILSRMYYKLGQESKSLKILSKSIELIEKIEDLKIKDNNFYLLTQVYLEFGKITQALQLIKKIKNARNNEKLFIQIAQKYLSNNQFEESVKILKKVKDDYFRTDLLIEILNTLLDNESKCKKILNQSFKIALKIENQTDRSKMLYFISKTYIELEQYSNALLLIKMIPKLNHKIWAFSDIACKLAKTGKNLNPIDNIILNETMKEF